VDKERTGALAEVYITLTGEGDQGYGHKILLTYEEERKKGRASIVFEQNRRRAPGKKSGEI